MNMSGLPVAPPSPAWDAKSEEAWQRWVLGLMGRDDWRWRAFRAYLQEYVIARYRAA